MMNLCFQLITIILPKLIHTFDKMNVNIIELWKRKTIREERKNSRNSNWRKEEIFLFASILCEKLGAPTAKWLFTYVMYVYN